MTHFAVLIAGPDPEAQLDLHGPDSEDPKWDWHDFGGRWPNHLILTDGTTAGSATRGQLDIEYMREVGRSTYALLVDGDWMAPGEVGWFGTGTDTGVTREAHQERAWAVIEALPPETPLAVYDLHAA